jgi:hypothetical protein
MNLANPLARLESAHRMLDEARTVDEVKEIRDQAEVARLYARERDLGLEAQNYAAEIKIRAERKLGALLAAVPRSQGLRSDLTSSPGVTKSAYEETLAAAGINHNQGHQWQQIAAIEDPEFEQHIVDAKAEERPLTTSRVVDLARTGFDPTTLPPMRLSRAENAYFAIPKLGQWLDVDPAEIAEAADPERIEANAQFFGSIDQWLQAVIRELEARQHKPFTVVGRTA